VQETRRSPTLPFPNHPQRRHRLPRVRLRRRPTTRRPRLQRRPRPDRRPPGHGQPLVKERPAPRSSTRRLLPLPAHHSRLRRRGAADWTPTSLTRAPVSSPEPPAVGCGSDRRPRAPLLEWGSLDSSRCRESVGLRSACRAAPA